MKADLLRQKFLEFFESKGHKIAESDSLVPKDDFTVLFTPAGMNQFKKQFMGYLTGFSRAATAQRCLRTDDLDKVGKTSGHHTFFEMLGNFSFGDYFKEEAIAWAWEFLTLELKIPKDRLWVSVYKDDDQAYRIWKDGIGVPAGKIVKLGDKENFWPSEAKEKGPNGPCGPCSEIFFDQGKDAGCKRPECGPSCGCGRFMEVWNLVFTQFNRKDSGVIEPLPKQNIDTGMGLERLAAVMQGVPNNFRTDLFAPIINEIISGIKRPEPDIPMGLVYAVSDHVRAVAFAIYDGVLPSNEARGYVVRKLIRKSALNLRTLGISRAFLYKLVPVVSEAMRVPYPDLDKRRENISEIVLAEENNFISTLDSSGALLKEKFSGLKDNPDPEKAGYIAFQLYDTYGIPLELTRGWLDEHSISVSEEAFESQLKEQKMRSKAQSAMKGDVFDLKRSVLGVKATEFTGYDRHETATGILKIIKDDAEVNEIGAGEEAGIILDKTVFYPESGGQVGDTGEVIKGESVFSVADTRKTDGVIIHIGKVTAGSFKTNDAVSARVDSVRRLAVARNHTATHLLQAALRKVLGAHVQQQGSLVAPERLRFDFTHFKDISRQELARIEDEVCGYILGNLALEVRQMPVAQAKESGALAFFAEKYEGTVRVVSISDVSRELCAGSHLNSTGEIGIFKITQEGSVSSGIRRIEAVTASAAYRLIKEREKIVEQAASLLNVAPERVIQELEKRCERIKELEKQLSQQKLEVLKRSLDDLIRGAQDIDGMKVVTRQLDGFDIELLRKTIDLIKQKTGNSVVALGSSTQGRALLVVGVTQDLIQKGLDSSRLIAEMAKVIGGSGGGRKDFAQGGGSKPEDIPAAFEKLKEMLKR